MVSSRSQSTMMRSASASSSAPSLLRRNSGALPPAHQPSHRSMHRLPSHDLSETRSHRSTSSRHQEPRNRPASTRSNAGPWETQSRPSSRYHQDDIRVSSRNSHHHHHNTTLAKHKPSGAGMSSESHPALVQHPHGGRMTTTTAAQTPRSTTSSQKTPPRRPGSASSSSSKYLSPPSSSYTSYPTIPSSASDSSQHRPLKHHSSSRRIHSQQNMQPKRPHHPRQQSAPYQMGSASSIDEQSVSSAPTPSTQRTYQRPTFSSPRGNPTPLVDARDPVMIISSHPHHGDGGGDGSGAIIGSGGTVATTRSQGRLSAQPPPATYHHVEEDGGDLVIDPALLAWEEQRPAHAKVFVSVRAQEALKQHIRTARALIEELGRTQTTDRKIASITMACECFDHHDEAKHNIELYHGAAKVLTKLLGQGTKDDEIRMVGAALEMVLRGSPKSVRAADERIGPGVLLAYITRLLMRAVREPMKHADVITLSMAKILVSLARETEQRPTMCRHPDLLPTVLVMLEQGSTNGNNTVGTNHDVRVVLIRFLASLANCDDNKVYLYQHEGVLDLVLRLAYFDSSDVVRQYAASVLMSLATASANQVPMARNEKVLGTIVKMGLSEKNEATRELVITALQNLAFSKENRNILVTFREGIVLEALKKSLLSDPDPKARRRAAGALTNLACDETGQNMGNHQGLLEALAIAATKDDDSAVQTRASVALTKVAGAITVEMACFPIMLDALVVASLSQADNSVSAVLRVKARDPSSRAVLARHPGVLDTLADICLSDAATPVERDNAVRTLMHLVNDAKNRKIMCSKTILKALVTAANYKNSNLDNARDSAIRAMERMATEVTNRATMARHEGLLTVVAKAVEREAKWEAEGRESELGYLAKPLLMSLLLAM